MTIGEMSGHRAFCPKHGYYWSEDGCAVCWDEAELAEQKKRSRLKNISPYAEFVNCDVCGTRYWGEDVCPKCHPDYPYKD